MAVDFITAIANAIGSMANAAKPIIDEHLAQKYQHENNERIKEWQKIMGIKNTGDRADHLELFIIKLCNDAGETWLHLGGNISVPVDALSALVKIASEKIQANQTLNYALRFK
jgi:hypothetical protein